MPTPPDVAELATAQEQHQQEPFPRIIKIFLVVALIVGMIGTSGFFGFRDYQHRRWNAAYSTAQYAFARAYEYRDAGALLFEPRWKDYEAAEDTLERTSTPDGDAGDELMDLRNCRKNLPVYRMGLGIDEKWGAATLKTMFGSCLPPQH